VIWTGSQRDVVGVYNALDVCCLSSAFGEGFSNVLGEAMACGIPCVATDVGDAGRIIDTCGVVVHPGDPRRLAEALRRVLTAAGPHQKRACRERVEREFSLDRMVKETERLLRACVDASA
jgi:glycosyltransferase involved in cell wall biosynthesis